MNKIWISVISIIMLLSSQTGVGQIVIDKSDMPSKGDTVRISTGLNTDFIDISETGADYNWDFSNLTPFTQRIDTFVNAKATPPPAGALFKYISDFASRLVKNLPFPDMPVSDPYQYYKSTDGSYRVVGFALRMQGFGIPAVFSTPDVLYKFPLSYQDIDSSFSGTEATIPNAGFIKIDRKRKNNVDGWGTLTTPYGTFEVLRVKSEVSEYDSVYLDSQEMGFGIPYSYTEYKWLAKNQKVPVLTVRDIVGGLLVEYPDSIRGTLGIDEKINNITQFTLFPNPTTNIVSVSFAIKKPGNIAVALTDISGKIIYRSEQNNLNKGSHLINIDLTNYHLKKGNYFITLKANNKTVTRKIIYLP